MKLPEIFKNKIEYPNNKCYISSNKDIYTSFPFKAIITTNNYSNKGIIVFGKTKNYIITNLGVIPIKNVKEIKKTN